jgi:hypothetical protein
VYAHLSDIDFGAKFSEASISPNEIERLIKLSKELVNKLSYANDRSTFAFNEPFRRTLNVQPSGEWK